MYRIAIYGKGGSGKSTVAAALSVSFARRGLRVLHVGCDPKSDSTLCLTEGRRIPTMLDLLAAGRRQPAPAEFVQPGRLSIDCVEAGGPKPGAGCGGRGIARMFEIFESTGFLRRAPYDVVLFDVVGDVVCGGFAAPLRLGFAERAFIVVSEEPLSLYAANNIVHAIESYGANGVELGGLVVNVSDSLARAAVAASLARAIGTVVAGTIPRDPRIQEAELAHLTAAELPPESPTARAVEELATRVLESFDSRPPRPRALALEELQLLLGSSPRRGPTGGEAEDPPSPPSAVAPPLPPHPAEAPAAARSLPEGGTVIGGGQSRGAIGSLLGLDRKPLVQLWGEVVDFRRERASFLVTLQFPAQGKLELALREEDGAESYARTKWLAVAHRSPLTHALRKVLDRLVQELARRGVRGFDLAALLAADPASQLAPTLEERRDARKGEVSGAPRNWTSWHTGDNATLFCFPEERARQLMAEVRLAPPVLRVHHATSACQASEADNGLTSWHFVRFPWRTDERAPMRHEGPQYLTNIGDHELIGGSTGCLTALLDQLQPGEPPETVVVDVSCTPLIAGEDWRGAITRFAARWPRPVLVSAMGAIDLPLAIARAAGQEALAAAEATGGPGRPVHLVGFPENHATGELAALLGRAGLAVGQRQFPTVALDSLGTYCRAGSQLLWPVREWQPLYDEFARKLPLPAELVPPPFGISGVRAFVTVAARAGGLDPAVAWDRLAEEVARSEEELAALAQLCRGHRLGIPLQSRQAELATNPELTGGVPLRTFLEELGFAVEVLLDCQDLQRLQWWLGSGLSAVYSDLAVDHRLTEKGIGHFATADLEPGLAGAVRTARRLLRLCQRPYLRSRARSGS